MAGLDKRSPHDCEIDQQPIVLFFPGGVLFESLPRHMPPDAEGLVSELSILIIPHYAVLNHVSPLDDVRVRTGTELQSCDRDQWKYHVGAIWPRKVFFLCNLHCQVHARVHSLFPQAARAKISIIAIDDHAADSLKILLTLRTLEPISEIWGIHQVFVDDQSSVRLEYHLISCYCRSAISLTGEAGLILKVFLFLRCEVIIIEERNILKAQREES